MSCKKVETCCTCLDWHEGDLAVCVSHWMRHFIFEGFYLEYTTLEAEPDRLLCHFGRCDVCGRCLCMGTSIPDEKQGSDLLATVYRWMHQIVRAVGLRLPAHYASFREMFVAAFHEADQSFVVDWLARPENQRIEQMYRNEKAGNEHESV